MRFEEIKKKFYRVSYDKNGKPTQIFFDNKKDAESHGLYLSEFIDGDILVTELEFQYFIEKSELTIRQNYRSIEYYQ